MSAALTGVSAVVISNPVVKTKPCILVVMTLPLLCQVQMHPCCQIAKGTFRPPAKHAQPPAPPAAAPAPHRPRRRTPEPRDELPPPHRSCLQPSSAAYPGRGCRGTTLPLAIDSVICITRTPAEGAYGRLVPPAPCPGWQPPVGRRRGTFPKAHGGTRVCGSPSQCANLDERLFCWPPFFPSGKHENEFLGLRAGAAEHF